jgi:hypothetical protein
MHLTYAYSGSRGPTASFQNIVVYGEPEAAANTKPGGGRAHARPGRADSRRPEPLTVSLRRFKLASIFSKIEIFQD